MSIKRLYQNALKEFIEYSRELIDQVKKEEPFEEMSLSKRIDVYNRIQYAHTLFDRVEFFRNEHKTKSEITDEYIANSLAQLVVLKDESLNLAMEKSQCLSFETENNLYA